MLACDEASYEYLFAQADAAFELEGCPRCERDDDDVLSDDEDDFGNNVLAQRVYDARYRCVTLPDGDIHLCDAGCPYAEEDREGNLVCPHTGRVVARCCAERTDLSTGRVTWSSDPDMQSGTPYGGWIKKRDMMSLSKDAFTYARQLDDSEMPWCTSAPGRARRSASKRGALCVDEIEVPDVGPKRLRTTKRDVDLTDVRHALLEEAERTLLGLLGKQRSGGRLSAKASTFDPRLLTKEVLFPAVLKKYLKEMRASGRLPQMDDVHNISLQVDKVIAEERAKAHHKSDRVRQPGFREAAARLAVTLWSGACRTPHMQETKRGTDAFRPFCAGVFYAFKRGLTLPDGGVLVPRVDAFTNALPSPRAIAADPAIKSLHASSHRGLKAIHRCINSVSAPEALKLFDEAVRAAKSVR